METERLSPAARATAVALASALLPQGATFPSADEGTVTRLEELLGHFGAGTVKNYGRLLGVLEHGARLGHRGRPFSKLTRDERERMLAAWSDASDAARRTLALALTAPLKIAYFDDEAIHDALGAKHRHGPPANMTRKADCRWRRPCPSNRAG